MAKLAKFLQGVAGAGGAGGLNVEEVFSTYLYEGVQLNNTNIVNGIDLSGEGGLVWIKDRSTTYHHYLYDTERGVTKQISSSQTNGEGADLDTITAFNSNGFTIGDDIELNTSGNDYVSWTFRKAPKFFTIVNYTGDGTTNRQISHDLGGTVGHITVKRTDTSAEWFNWHRTFSDNQLVAFSGTYAVGTYSNYLVTADSTTFTVGNNVDVNANGGTYVAYLWGHNDGDGDFGPNGDADIIKCGSYTGNGSSTGPSINLGFEPQWILTKRTDSTSQWTLVDNMRGMPVGGSDVRLYPNLTNADDPFAFVDVTPTGFNVATSASAYNASGGTYIYIAIRRGPMAVPESATDVFDIDTRNSTGTGVEPGYRSSSGVVDFALRKNSASGTDNWQNMARLIQGKFLEPNTTDAEATGAEAMFDYMNGYKATVGTNAGLYSWMWKRAPSFFDVVAYTGNGTAGRTVSHNLGVAPEMMWIKRRNTARLWSVYHKDLGPSDYLILNTSDAEGTGVTTLLNDTDPTSSVITLGSGASTNASGDTYIAYLFASLDGVSKVGSYSGDSTTGRVIDCGVSNGARFVLIKQTNGGGDWWAFDTERGITTSVARGLRLNTTDAEVPTGSPTQDYHDRIDPSSSGFIVNHTSALPINQSGSDYIFYAIA